MAQHDYSIANQSGSSFRADLNNALSAIVSNNSGTSQPSTTFAFQWWADTTNNVLKLRNSANDAWITLRELDGTMVIEDGSAGTPGLAFADDLNTGIFSSAADTLNISAGGTERAEFSSSQIIFNESGASYDFRVEGDTDTHLLFVDGSADRVGIGTSSPDGKLHVYSASAGTVTPWANADDLTIENSSATGLSILAPDNQQAQIIFGSPSDNIGSIIRWVHDDNELQVGTHNADGFLTFRTAVGAEAMRIDSSGNVGIGVAPAQKLDILTGTYRGFFDDGASNSGFRIRCVNAGNTATGPLQLGGDNVIFLSGPALGERARIDSSGNVGIGTSSPDELLHIQGNIAEFKGTNTNAISDTGGTQQVFKFGIEGQKNNVYGPAGSIIFRQAGLSWSSTNTYHKPTRIEFCSQDAGTADKSEIPRLVVDYTGNVGIGTSSPIGKLSVKVGDDNGNATNWNNNYFLVTSGDDGQSQALGLGVNTANDFAFLSSLEPGTAWRTMKYKALDHIFDGANDLERARIDSSGRLLVGTSTSVTSSVSQQSLLQVYSTSSSSSSVQIGNYTNGTNPAGLHFDKSRGALGTNTVLQSGDNIGDIKFNGADGTNLVRAASISCAVDGTPGANDMPGRLVFSTTADGASSPTEQMRLTSSGDLLVNAGFGSVYSAYFPRAFGVFNGSGTAAFVFERNFGGSVTDHGSGDYTVSFGTALSDANYAVVATHSDYTSTPGGDTAAINVGSQTTTSFRMRLEDIDGGTINDYINIVVVR